MLKSTNRVLKSTNRELKLLDRWLFLSTRKQKSLFPRSTAPAVERHCPRSSASTKRSIASDAFSSHSWSYATRGGWSYAARGENNPNPALPQIKKGDHSSLSFICTGGVSASFLCGIHSSVSVSYVACYIKSIFAFCDAKRHRNFNAFSFINDINAFNFLP